MGESTLSRRGFVAWSAAAAALAGGLTACSSELPEEGEAGGTFGDGAQPILEGGKWVTVPCTGCPQFRCVNRAYMVD